MVRRLPDRDERENAELALQALRAPALMATRGFANSEAEQAFRRTLELAERNGGEQKFPAAFGLAALLELRGEYVQSQRLLESYLQEQERTGQYVTEWRHLLACSTFHQGQFETALDHANKGLSGFSPDRHSELLRDYGENPGLECHTWAGLSLWFLGFPDKALYHSRRALEMAEKPESAYALANGAAQVAMVHQLRREVDESFACAETTIAAGKEQGMPYRIAIGNAIHGWALVQKGQWDEGMAEVQSAVAACERVGANLDLPYFLALQAESLAACNLARDADRVLEEALQRISSRSFFYEAELHRLRGCVQAQRERSRDAEQFFEQAVQVARRQKAKSLELRALTSWVKYSNGAAEPTKLLAKLYSSLTEGFETMDLRKAARALDEIAPAHARA
jgi:adenylate cyclase